MRQGIPRELTPHQGDAALFRAPRRCSGGGPADPVGAVVNHDDDDAPRQIEDLPDLVDRIPRPAEIVTVGMLAIHAVNHRIPLVIGLEADGLVAVPVGFHLLAVPSLDAEHLVLDPLDHLPAEGTVIRQEVEQPHGAGLAGIQVRQALAGGTADGRNLFGLEEQAGMQAVGGRRRGVACRQGAETESENGQESFHGWLLRGGGLRHCRMTSVTSTNDKAATSPGDLASAGK